MRKSHLILSVILLLTSLSQSKAQDGEKEKPTLDVGGALRFNYNLSTWKKEQVKRGGDFGFDLFRINAKATYKGVKLNTEYRLYSRAFGGGMLKQGWIGYDFSEKSNLQLGLTQVPFGITQYNSHNWFFGLTYYVGLEDDHDMGLKYTHKTERWEYAIAFFKNAEELVFGNTSDLSESRYSYDVASIDLDGDGETDVRNKETNQLNAKVVRVYGTKELNHRIGVSGQFGGLYNLDTNDMGYHYALAGHYELNAGPFNLKAEIADYAYEAKNPEGEPDNIVGMAAYGGTYEVAAEATLYTLAIAYTIPVSWGPVSNLQVYNDFGYMDKAEEDFEPTYMNVLGTLITAGQVYTYVDFAMGKDQPWLGPNWTQGLSRGSQDDWDMRFNINFGYYF